MDTRATGRDAGSYTDFDPQSRLRSRQKHTSDLHCDFHIGWGLHKPRDGAIRLRPNVKDYLKKKFKIGEPTGSKSKEHSMAVGF